MQPTLIVLALLVVGYIALKRFGQANPAVLNRRLKEIAGGVLLAGATALLSRGSFMAALVTGVAGVWLMLGGGMPSWPGRPGGETGAPGQTSAVKTEHLEMQLDHASGAMHGRILKGFFAGRRIEDLRPVELAHLWQDCRFADPASAQLVEAYLDRVHPSWRDDLARAEAQSPKGPDGKMTRGEALEILGLAEGASAEQIRRAHRELMLRLHPDRGGSTYLAAKINEAKDVALGG